MAANSQESLEERMADELLETKGPLAPRSLTEEDASEDENENSSDILDEQDDEERNPLLELKKCKDWLQQQKINHEAELLVRKYSCYKFQHMNDKLWTRSLATQKSLSK